MRLMAIWGVVAMLSSLNPGGVLAQVVSLNGVQIDHQDLANYTQQMLKPEVRASGLARPNVVLQMVENLYVLRRAAAEAEATGLTDEKYSQWLGGYYQTRYGADQYVSQVNDLDLADEATLEVLAREYYTANKAEFLSPPQVNVDHILIGFEGKPWPEVVEKVATVQSELDAGANFSDIASVYSDDPSVATNRGALGWVREGKTDPAFERAAFAMSDPGEITGPVLSSFGVHFIRFNGREEAVQLEYDKVSLIIANRLQKKAPGSNKQKAFSVFREELRPLLSGIDQESVLEEIRLLLQE